MALGGCLTCIKYLMFVFNFIFWLIGCVILSVGIYILAVPQSLEAHGETIAGLKVATYVLITVGSIIMVVGFLGCCGAIRESQCLLALFFIFLFIIFAILVALGIYFVYNPQKFMDEVTNTLTKSFKDHVQNYNNGTDSKELVDQIQKEYKCCGYSQGLADFPPRSNPPGCDTIGFTRPEVCTSQVYEKTLEQLRKNMVIVAGVALGIALVMLLGMIFSMMLCCAIRDGM